MTYLEAINTILSVIGEAPISGFSDLESNEITDAALAQRTLDEINTQVQNEGWGWNTNYAVPIQPDSAMEYVVPSNALQTIFSPNRYADRQYIVRGNRVYDRNQQTYKIADSENPQPLVADSMSIKLDWLDLPYAAQQYITIRAARIYSDRFTNSNVIFTYTAQDEDFARAQLVRVEESTLSNNLLFGNDRGMGAGLGYVPAQGRLYRRN